MLFVFRYFITGMVGDEFPSLEMKVTKLFERKSRVF
jgi:hypothetical protein